MFFSAERKCVLFLVLSHDFVWQGDSGAFTISSDYPEDLRVTPTEGRGNVSIALEAVINAADGNMFDYETQEDNPLEFMVGFPLSLVSLLFKIFLSFYYQLFSYSYHILCLCFSLFIEFLFIPWWTVFLCMGECCCKQSLENPENPCYGYLISCFSLCVVRI